MPGAENRPGQVRTLGLPNFQRDDALGGIPGQGAGERGGSDTAQAFNGFLDALTPRRERRQSYTFTHPFDAYALMENFNDRFEERRWNELGFRPTEEQNQTVYRIRLAYGILAYHHCTLELLGGGISTIYQDTIKTHIALDRVRNGNIRIVLTNTEQEILAKIAKAVGIPYNPQKKEYLYSEISQKTLHNKDLYSTPTVVDTDPGH